MSERNRYFLGLPAWAFPGWKDRYFADSPSRLESYAQVFNAVEGNTTFYRTPDADTARRWHDAVADRHFHFCFKLPRGVTHEREPDLGTLDGFLDAIRPLSKHLGPILVQFPATLHPDKMERFFPVFSRLAEHHRFVIEVRHPLYFDEPGLLEPVLESYGAGRAILDARPLFEGDRRHPELLAALHEKPDVPVLPGTYNELTLVRLILHPDIVSNRAYIDEWSSRVAGYLGEGVTTYMMIHCPNNLHCPPLALDFHESLRRTTPELGFSALAPWPVPQQADFLSG